MTEQKASKRSVSIPSDLLKEAKAATGEESVSRLVQEALANLVAFRRQMNAPLDTEERDEPPEIAGVDPRQLHEIKARLARGAKEAFENGYRDGVELASRVSWAAFDSFREHGYDVVRWLRKSKGYPDLKQAVEEIFADEVEGPDGEPWEIGGWEVVDEAGLGGGTYRDGLTAALREIYDSIVPPKTRQSWGTNSKEPIAELYTRGFVKSASRAALEMEEEIEGGDES